jgi:hypothetical protein
VTLRRRVEIECCRVGISRAELARRVGKLPQALNDMLARGDMKASLLKSISSELDVTMERLLTPVNDEEYKLWDKAGRSGKAADFFDV